MYRNKGNSLKKLSKNCLENFCVKYNCWNTSSNSNNFQRQYKLFLRNKQKKMSAEN